MSDNDIIADNELYMAEQMVMQRVLSIIEVVIEQERTQDGKLALAKLRFALTA